MSIDIEGMGENRELIRDNRVTIDNVYSADFETNSSPNLEKDGCVRVYIWSLIRVSDRKNGLVIILIHFWLESARLRPKYVIFIISNLTGILFCTVCWN